MTIKIACPNSPKHLKLKPFCVVLTFKVPCLIEKVPLEYIEASFDFRKFPTKLRLLAV